jgi:hypothetical protein
MREMGWCSSNYCCSIETLEKTSFKITLVVVVVVVAAAAGYCSSPHSLCVLNSRKEATWVGLVQRSSGVRLIRFAGQLIVDKLLLL